MAQAARTGTGTSTADPNRRFAIARRMAAKRTIDATIAKPIMRSAALTQACLAAAGFDDHRAHYG